MGGVIGRLFQEFALTVTFAILISAVMSLTVTPMICARFMRAEHAAPSTGRLARALERFMQRLTDGYARSLGWTLRHERLMLLLMLLTIVATVVLFRAVPKGFIPRTTPGC